MPSPPNPRYLRKVPKPPAAGQETVLPRVEVEVPPGVTAEMPVDEASETGTPNEEGDTDD